jgi:hypothetical protein
VIVHKTLHVKKKEDIEEERALLWNLFAAFAENKIRK